ncbi:MAG TPA: sigma factor [Gemmatimonadales bacterium]|nr:sigma factor [Gemmatimonadales bacterium]
MSGHPPPAADQSLVARIARGDADALSELQQRHGGSVYALAYGMLVDAAEADEVVAETFAYAWQRAAQFLDAASGSVFAWLTGIARSRARAVLQARDWPRPWLAARSQPVPRSSSLEVL